MYHYFHWENFTLVTWDLLYFCSHPTIHCELDFVDFASIVCAECLRYFLGKIPSSLAKICPSKLHGRLGTSFADLPMAWLIFILRFAQGLSWTGVPQNFNRLPRFFYQTATLQHTPCFDEPRCHIDIYWPCIYDIPINITIKCLVYDDINSSFWPSNFEPLAIHLVLHPSRLRLVGPVITGICNVPQYLGKFEGPHCSPEPWESIVYYLLMFILFQLNHPLLWPNNSGEWIAVIYPASMKHPHLMVPHI